ncbi:hypothetical protein VSS92_28715, partial [Pseudomonas syringae pv. tagetis]
PDRLSRGVEALCSARMRSTNIPGILHVTRTTICDEDLTPLRPAPLYTRPPGFANALVQACTPAGSTSMVLPGVTLLKAAQAGARAAG